MRRSAVPLTRQRWSLGPGWYRSRLVTAVPGALATRWPDMAVPAGTVAPPGFEPDDPTVRQSFLHRGP
jgi:hypothetical protein